MNPDALHAPDSPSTAAERSATLSGPLEIRVSESNGMPPVMAIMQNHAEIPPMDVAIEPSTVLARLLALSKRGKLPGYAATSGAPGGTGFQVEIFGAPYDRVLHAVVSPREEGGSRLSFESRLGRKLPAIAIITTVLSIQPGLWLTDSMLRAYFSWYRIPTWWWYMPLVLLSIPYLWKQYKKSEQATLEETRQTLAIIEKELGAKA